MKNEEIDYTFLIIDFLESYKYYHTKEETIKLMDEIISKKHISILTNDLKEIGPNKLSEELTKIVLEQIRSEIPNKVDLTELLPSIVKNNLRFVEDSEISSTNSSLKRTLLTGTIGAICLTSLLATSPKNNASTTSNKEDKVIVNNLDINFKQIPSDSFILKENNPIEKQKVSEKNNSSIEIKKKSKEELEREVLNKFKKCKSLKEILKRQKELENLNLTKEDKIYKKCKLSAPLQRFIYEQSIINKVPIDFLFSIIYTETRGDFNSSGSSSYNAPGNYDLGLTQQNTRSSVQKFAEVYNVDYDKACKLIKNNDYVNVVSSFLEIGEIKTQFDNYNPIEYAGCYNGWLTWKNKSISREYVEIFDQAYNQKFTKHHHIESKKVKVKK